MIDNENRISQTVIWDHKLQARAHIVKCLQYMFDEEQDPSKNNIYGAILFEASEALVNFYFSYAASLIEKGYCEILDTAHQQAKIFIAYYQNTDFVRGVAVTSPTSLLFQRLSLLDKSPELEVKEPRSREPVTPLTVSLEPNAKRVKAAFSADKENTNPHSNKSNDPKFFAKAPEASKQKESGLSLKME